MNKKAIILAIVIPIVILATCLTIPQTFKARNIHPNTNVEKKHTSKNIAETGTRGIELYLSPIKIPQVNSNSENDNTVPIAVKMHVNILTTIPLENIIYEIKKHHYIEIVKKTEKCIIISYPLNYLSFKTKCKIHGDSFVTMVVPEKDMFIEMCTNGTVKAWLYTKSKDDWAELVDWCTVYKNGTFIALPYIAAKKVLDQIIYSLMGIYPKTSNVVYYIPALKTSKYYILAIYFPSSIYCPGGGGKTFEIIDFKINKIEPKYIILVGEENYPSDGKVYIQCGFAFGSSIQPIQSGIPTLRYIKSTLSYISGCKVSAHVKPWSCNSGVLLFFLIPLK